MRFAQGQGWGEGGLEESVEESGAHKSLREAPVQTADAGALCSR